jgi:hypothetical protein
MNILVKAYVQSSLAQRTFRHYFQVCLMHNVKVQASSTLMLPQVAAGQVYASKHYAWSGYETEQS